MEMQLANTDAKYTKVALKEPAPLGYLHLAAEIQPYSLPLGLFIPDGRKKVALVKTLKEIAQQLEQLAAVEKVTVYKAVAMPPLSRMPYVKDHLDTVRLARFDLVVLIETTSPSVVSEVQETRSYQVLVDTLQAEAKQVHIMAARNAKRVADVDKTKQGLFIFNYFVAEDVQVGLQLWDYMAGWYEAETGLDNSTVLVPLDDTQSDYPFVNHARWDFGLLQFMWQQLSKRSFRSYVQANLTANRVGAMPVMYQLA